MARMSLGGYTFALNPSIYNQPLLMTPEKRIASVETYDSIAVFSWGASIVGKVLTLKWGYMLDSMYQELLTLFVADTSVVFDPNDGTGSTYTVELTALDARYHYKLHGGGGDVWRSDVTLDLLVLGEVS